MTPYQGLRVIHAALMSGLLLGECRYMYLNMRIRLPPAVLRNITSYNHTCARLSAFSFPKQKRFLNTHSQNTQFAITPKSARKMSTASSAPSTAMNSTATSSADVTAASSQSDLALPQSSPYVLRYIDIGINLTDRQFHGEYHGKQV